MTIVQENNSSSTEIFPLEMNFQADQVVNAMSFSSYGFQPLLRTKVK